MSTNLAFCHSSEYDNNGIIRQNNVTVSYDEGTENLNGEHLDSQMFTSFSHTKTSANLCFPNDNFESYYIEQRPKHIIIAGGRGINLPSFTC